MSARFDTGQTHHPAACLDALFLLMLMVYVFL